MYRYNKYKKIKIKEYFFLNLKFIANKNDKINTQISKKVISNYLSDPILKNIDHLILACTHYPLIQNEINEYYKGKVNVIDSAKIVANHITESLKLENLLKETKVTKHHFYVSNYTESFEKSARFFFKEEVKLEEINLHL